MVAITAVEVVGHYGFAVRCFAMDRDGSRRNDPLEDHGIRRESRIAWRMAVADDRIAAGFDCGFLIPENVAICPCAQEEAVNVGLSVHIERKAAGLIVGGCAGHYRAATGGFHCRSFPVYRF